MKKVLSLLLVLLAFISVISPAAYAISTTGAALNQEINHPALWGNQKIISAPASTEKESSFDGRIILIIVVALMGIIVSTALILLNVKYSKIRKEEEAEDAEKAKKSEKKENKK